MGIGGGMPIGGITKGFGNSGTFTPGGPLNVPGGSGSLPSAARLTPLAISPGNGKSVKLIVKIEMF